MWWCVVHGWQHVLRGEGGMAHRADDAVEGAVVPGLGAVEGGGGNLGGEQAAVSGQWSVTKGAALRVRIHKSVGRERSCPGRAEEVT